MKKTLLILIAALQTSFAFAGLRQQNTPADEIREISPDYKEPLFVSLGPDCYFAFLLDDLGYRKAAYPFDWLLTLDNDRFVELLDDDFKLYFEPAYFSKHNNGALIHTYYHLEFRHEHDNEFRAKYERRIRRFRELGTYPGCVFFMRRGYYGGAAADLYWPNPESLEVSSEHACKLNAVLKKKFPILNFKLVIVNYSASEDYVQVSDDFIFFNFTEYKPVNAQLQSIVDVLLNYARSPESYESGLHYPVPDKSHESKDA